MTNMRILTTAATVLLLLSVAPLFVPPFYLRVLQLFFMYAGLASAWNILGGFSGYWSFGHTVFIGIGAFAAGHLSAYLFATGAQGPIDMVLVVFASAAVCGIFSGLIAYPVLRLRGVYFSTAMLAISQVVTEVVNSISWFKGSMGIFVPFKVPLGLAPENFFYYTFGVALLSIVLISSRITRSKFGYGLIAIREDEDTARMQGIPTEQYKAMAFVLSSILVGMLGAIYAYSVGYFTTGTVFRLDFSLNMIVFCLIGGVGTISGPLFGAALLLFVMHILLGDFLDIHLMITGAVVVAAVLLMPSGIVGTYARWSRNRAERRWEANRDIDNDGLEQRHDKTDS